jgi:hypothetical protein
LTLCCGAEFRCQNATYTAEALTGDVCLVIWTCPSVTFALSVKLPRRIPFSANQSLFCYVCVALSPQTPGAPDPKLALSFSHNSARSFGSVLFSVNQQNHGLDLIFACCFSSISFDVRHADSSLDAARSRRHVLLYERFSCTTNRW